MKKLVFSKKKYKKSMYQSGAKEAADASIRLGWPDICDGLTEKEMNELYYHTCREWMV